MKYTEEYAKRRLEEMDRTPTSYLSETEHLVLCWAFALAMPVGWLLSYFFGGA